jgi:hypothetical protein
VSSKYQGEERRKYFRLQPSLPKAPRADIFVGEEEQLSVQVINVSPGGLLFYATQGEDQCSVNQTIPRIDIFFPDKEPVTYSGVIRRIQPTQAEGRYFCAIEFLTMVLSDGKKIIKLSKELHPGGYGVPSIPDSVFLRRVAQVENYIKLLLVEEQIVTRDRAYESFRDITFRLPVEEQWWFFEILDEMKRREPNYPEGLRKEFIRLCRKGCLGKDYTKKARLGWSRWKSLVGRIKAYLSKLKRKDDTLSSPRDTLQAGHP